MKWYFMMLLLIVSGNSFLKSQTTNSYPFKTFLDSANNLYIAGHSDTKGTRDIYVAKFPPNSTSPPFWYDVFESHLGNDRGLDLTIDKHGNTCVTGYIYNGPSHVNDAIILCYNPAGELQWSRILEHQYDDKGYGADLILDQDGNAINLFITGYRTSQSYQKDIFVSSYDMQGNLLFDTTYNSPYNFDDVKEDDAD